MSEIDVISFMCDLEGHHSDSVKILKIVEWLLCISIVKTKVFIEVCVYYQIWISGFAHITAPIYYLFQNGISFEWVEYQQKAMDLLKKWLMTVLMLKSINYHENAGDIVFIININGHGWGAVLMQYAADSK